jgi:hypothetical protein
VIPQLRRIPQQLVLMPVIWLALAGLSRLRLPRWSLAVASGILSLVCLAPEFIFAESFIVSLAGNLVIPLAISALLLLPGALVGRIAARGGSKRDGDVAMAIFASCAIGQYLPFLFHGQFFPFLY